MMRVRILVLLLFCFSSIAFLSPAQDIDYNIEYLTIDHGLPQNEVTSIIQDKKGFLWFGTRGGLARYDGYNMKIFQYEPGNTNSLSNNSIETLYESSDGMLWIGTKSGGLNCFDPFHEKFSVYQFDPANANSISGNRVVSVSEDRHGRIWAGTWENGLNWLDRKTGKFHRMLEGKQVLNLKITTDGTLWAAADNAIYKLKPGTHYQQRIYFGLPDNVSLTSIAIDEGSSRLFVSGWETGLIIYDYKQNKIVARPVQPVNIAKSNSADDLYSLLLDDSKKLWMGFWGDGLQAFHQDGSIKKISVAPHLQGKYNTDYDIVLTIFQDRARNLWIGTDGGGVCKLSAKSKIFKSFTLENSGLSTGHVLSLLEDSKGRVWIGTKGGGLNELQGQNIIHHKEIYEALRDIKVNDVHTIYEDFNGDIWFGSNYGLHRIRSIVNNQIQFETITRGASGNALSDEKVMAILRDRKGRFWVGTQQQGLNKLTHYDASGKPLFKVYKADPKNPFSLAENRISCLFEDSKGRIWIGTYKGLHLYDENVDGFLKLYHEPAKSESLSNDIVICITEDTHGNIWAGTAGGLNKITIENSTIRSIYFTKKDGLPNDYINSILPDAKGNLWLSSNGGLFRFSTKSGQIHFFNAGDGLQSNAFSENAACKNTAGLMYFGGINGFNVLDPRAELKTTPCPLSFVSLRIMNKEIGPGEKINNEQILEQSFPYTKEITLTHLDKVITVEVASLDFNLPEKNQYAFKLEGFDNEWFNTQSRAVTYTNLKPGTYTLLARSTEVGNAWTGKPIVLGIIVLPPPWKTWWAYCLYLTAFIIIALIIISAVKKQIKLKEALRDAQLVSAKAELEKSKELEMSEMKFRFFTNVSHELKTPLTLIISPLEELLTHNDIPKIFRDKLSLMQRHSQRLLTLIHQLLDLRKSESGNMKLLTEQRDIVTFVFEVFESFTHLAEKRRITYTFESDIDQLLVDFDQNKIEMAVTNIFSNAFKYTPDTGKINCHISVEKDRGSNKTYCAISIRDSGMGMPKDVLNKIFDLYYQVAVVDSVKISGTGIGLSLVKEIIQLHGGLVSVESDEGRGSTFTIRLPLKQVSASSNITKTLIVSDETKGEKQLDRQELQGSEKPMLLIIEDTDELRHYVADLLHDEYQVLQSPSGEEGLKCALEKIPDIIVSDVMMEKMDGFELCHRIKNNEKTSHIPVILLTARIMPENELSGLHAGADDYIKKPFNPAILIARIARLLESRKQLKEYYSRKITLQPTNIEITSYDERFLQKAMTYIEANLLNPDLSAESLGYELAMSHSTLYRKLKALTGQSINEFMRSIRLKRAAQLLETGEYSIAEVAFQTGFSEVKYFRTYFKEQFGCLPSEYAKQKNQTMS